MRICPDTTCRTPNNDTAPTCHRCGASLRHALHLLNPGTRVGRYRILSLIGHGGVGAVYRAEVISHPDVHVALKETLDPTSIKLFRAEFEVLCRLRHEHLPRYYEAFESNGNGYMSMAFIPGTNLAEQLDRHGGPLPEPPVISYAMQLCAALRYLHNLYPPLIHRDIKPANIRLTPEGKIILVDFGMFKTGTDATETWRRGLTPVYAPPEQWGIDGQHTDTRSDIYSVGATLYHLLTGHKPVSAPERRYAASDPLVLPRHHNQALSAHIAKVIGKAMAINRHERFADAETFFHGLRAVTGELRQPHRTHNRRVPRPSRQGKATDLLVQTPPPNPQRHTLVAVQPVQRLNGHAFAVNKVAWSPDGKLLASGSDDSTVRLWNVATTRLLHTLRGHTDSVSGIAWNPTSSNLASSSPDGSVHLWRVQDGMRLRTLHHTFAVNGLAWSPDGYMLASCCVSRIAQNDSTVQLWNVADATQQHVLEGHAAPVVSVAWSPDSRLLATGSDDSTVRLWQVHNGHSLHVLHQNAGQVACVAWNPEGTFLAVGSTDTVQIWRVQDGCLLATLTGHTGWVYSVAWSPDGRVLASGGRDKTIRLWQAQDGRMLHTLEGHEGWVYGVAWSPDGNTLASASGDSTVRLWRLVYG